MKPNSCPRQNRLVQCNDPISGYPLAMAYIPWQTFRQTYDLSKALYYGTIFPDLNKPFCGKRGCRL